MSKPRGPEYFALSTAGHARCSRCSAIKGLKYFDKDKGSPNGHSCYCRTCRSHVRRESYQRSGGIDRVFWKHILRQYGLTRAAYESMVEEQQGKCFICDRVPEPSAGRTRALNVDHDHATGAVRRLLCRQCNQLLGWLEADPALVEACLAYLWEFAGVNA